MRRRTRRLLHLRCNSSCKNRDCGLVLASTPGGRVPLSSLWAAVPPARSLFLLMACLVGEPLGPALQARPAGSL
jgi:hypothetical protein